jgi:DNA-binding GntR family transcriptional regulator
MRILDIVDRTLPPGHRIRQNELAEQLGVSRQPVSHALHLLHRQGLVAESGRKGFEVTRLDPVRIRQLYEVRGAIDALAPGSRPGARTDAPARSSERRCGRARHEGKRRWPADRARRRFPSRDLPAVRQSAIEE